MRFISVRDLRSKSAQVWRQLNKTNQMVITSNGRPIALLTPVDEDNIEAALNIHKQVQAQLALSKIHRNAEKSGQIAMSLKQINHEIKQSRRKRKPIR